MDLWMHRRLIAVVVVVKYVPPVVLTWRNEVISCPSQSGWPHLSCLEAVSHRSSPMINEQLSPGQDLDEACGKNCQRHPTPFTLLTILTLGLTTISKHIQKHGLPLPTTAYWNEPE